MTRALVAVASSGGAVAVVGGSSFKVSTSDKTKQMFVLIIYNDFTDRT